MYKDEEKEKEEKEHERLVTIQLSMEDLEKTGKIMGQNNNLVKLIADGLKFKEKLDLFLKNGGDLNDATDIVLRVLRGLESSLSEKHTHFSVGDSCVIENVKKIVRDLLKTVNLPEDTICIEISMDISRDVQIAQQLLIADFAQQMSHIYVPM